jgi:hypothetical protein
MSISTVTSEALQLKLRELLPSQQGFGTDLSASDTIIPIIDLTAAAEGSGSRTDLQTALAFGSQTVFNVNNTTTTLTAGTGFWRFFGNYGINSTGQITVNLNDGASDKLLYQFNASSDPFFQNVPFDFIVFFNTGETMKITANANARASGSTRQIADINGTLVQPSGFSPQ